MPLANRGSGPDADNDGIPDNDEPGAADDDAINSTAVQAEEPFQTCNDNVDNDSDSLTDNAEAACGGAGANPDTDLDGIKDAVEIGCGPAGISTDGTKVPERLGNSIDDDGDGSTDEAQASAGAFDCDGDGFNDSVEAAMTWPAASGAAETTGAGQCNDSADDDADTIVNDGCLGAVSHQGRCADSTSANNEDDDQWPADFNDDGKLNIQDLNSFTTPAATKHYNQAVANHHRWDLTGSGATINLVDINAAATLKPPDDYYTRALSSTLWGAAGTCPGDATQPPQ
jgi:hypothetical protein